MEHIKYTLDSVSLITAFSTLIGLLPPIAALASLVWTGIQIYDWWKKQNAT